MRVTLTEGISGGFAPPEVRRVIKFDTTSKVVEETTKEGGEYVTKTGNLPNDVVLALVEKAEKLRHLPTEFPPFSSDLYGLDTSVVVEAEDFQWGNGAPEGCIWSEPTITISSENKQDFKDAVDEILSVGKFVQ